MKEKQFNIIATIVIVLIAVAIAIAAMIYAPEETPPKNVAPQVQQPATAEGTNAVIYTNNDFHFSVTLPPEWKGFTIVKNTWLGQAIGDTGDIPFTSGPLISVRDPRWTNDAPRQDIPIMIFTLKQWDEMKAEQYHIGAAPIPPSELGRNADYVFALPARYNFAFPPGYEEVQRIIETGSFHAY